MDPQLKEALVKRLKSFGWRLACYVVVALVGFVLEQLKLFPISPTIVAVIALVLGEVSKWFNNNTNLFGGRLK